MSRLVFADVEVDGGRITDVAVENGRIAAVGPLRPQQGDFVVPGQGGALIWGLADHHLHLHAYAASLASVACGPPEVRNAEELAAAIANAGATDNGWIRGIGYHESVAGELDRRRLDTLAPDRPLRIQHRSGALWMLNSAALRTLGIEADHPTGRLWRLDGRLRELLPANDFPDLTEVGRQYASFGITSLVDATPDLSESAVQHIRAAVEDGSLPQDVTLLTSQPAPYLWRDFPDRLYYGPTKLLPPDHAPWPYEELVRRIRTARGAPPHGVAIHVVTREALVLTLAALAEVGPPDFGRDRIEHAAIVPPESMPELARRRIHVVTQPGFVAERGDEYATDVDPRDLPYLYPFASLVRAGVGIGLSSDAPYSDPDPWRIIRAARDRRTPSGRVLGPDERLTAREAFHALGARARPSTRAPLPLTPGGRADLCLLRVPLAAALAEPHRDVVRTTVCAGRIVYDAP